MNASGKPPSIVVMEDSDEDFETVRDAIRKAGITVETRRAINGEQCMELLRGLAEHPALILMDLNTSGEDGRDALISIKSDPAFKVIPLIVFTTSADPRDLSYCYQAGANAYHVKPVRYADHLQLLADLLGYWFLRVALPVSNGVIL